MDLSGWLEPGAVVPRLGAANKRQVLAAVAEIAGRRFGCAPSEVLDALLAREGEGSTGVGYGAALPHARLACLIGMRAGFARLETPGDFAAVDDQPVDLVFALFAPQDAGSEHLRALARVSRLLGGKDLREQLRQARSADALYVLIASEASASAA